MSNLLKEKLGFVEDYNSPEDAINSIVKLLNQSTAQANQSSQSSDSISISGVELTSPTFTYTGGNQVYNYTLTHNLGVIPTKFIICDLTTSVGGTQYEHATIVRVSWTTTQISVKLSYYNGLGSGSGSFKILVLR